jgi:hypothetical protein
LAFQLASKAGERLGILMYSARVGRIDRSQTSATKRLAAPVSRGEVLMRGG